MKRTRDRIRYDPEFLLIWLPPPLVAGIGDSRPFNLKTLGYKAAGRLHTPKDLAGKVFANQDGQKFVIFKQTILDPAPGDPQKPEAMFRVQFQVPKISQLRDRLIISLKSPVFVALPGFRSKLWMVDEKNNTYQGVYEWNTLRDAEDYVHSYSMEFMTEVAVPGGISYEIIPSGRVVQKGSVICIEQGGAILAAGLPTRIDGLAIVH